MKTGNAERAGLRSDSGLKGKIAVREEFTEIICVSAGYNYMP
jgi:hypothetical protein